MGVEVGVAIRRDTLMIAMELAVIIVITDCKRYMHDRGCNGNCCTSSAIDLRPSATWRFFPGLNLNDTVLANGHDPCQDSSSDFGELNSYSRGRPCFCSGSPTSKVMIPQVKLGSSVTPDPNLCLLVLTFSQHTLNPLLGLDSWCLKCLSLFFILF